MAHSTEDVSLACNAELIHLDEKCETGAFRAKCLGHTREIQILDVNPPCTYLAGPVRQPRHDTVQVVLDVLLRKMQRFTGIRRRQRDANAFKDRLIALGCHATDRH
jgi:hypothetical protein